VVEGLNPLRSRLVPTGVPYTIETHHPRHDSDQFAYHLNNSHITVDAVPAKLNLAFRRMLRLAAICV